MRTASSSGASPLPPSGRGRKSHPENLGKVDNHRKILIIDDNRVFLKATSFKLKGAGYHVITAEDGPDAIGKVREEKPDLILLDLNFPPDVAHGGGVAWDGFLILNWLRRIDDAQSIPVIVVTSGDSEECKERCLAAGVVDLFPKPIDHDALLVTIQKTLNKTASGHEEGTPDSDPRPQPGDQGAYQPRHAHYADTEPEPEPEPQSKSPVGKKILLVDDENDWRYMGSLYLTECGYEVSSTGDAIGALVQAGTIKPDLVVLDLNLGGESGITLMKLLASAHPTLPILIYTGMELTDAEISDLLEKGASECLRKGTMDELLTAVGTALGLPPGKTEVVPNSPDAPAVSLYLSGQPPKQPLTPDESPMMAAPREIEAIAQSNDQAGFDWLQKALGQESPTPDGTATETAPEQLLVLPESPGGEPEGGVESGTELVLIVSEDAGFTDELRAFLESQSYRVAGIDGAQAVACISESPVDFILFDMAVPSPHAEQFFGAVLSTTPDQCKRIVFMTNDDVDPKSDGFVRRAKAPMLWRPFAFEDLLQTLQTMRSQFSEAV